MTQLPHDEFETSLEKAEAWMKEIHERLKENDNTQGPRSALETRLRETEKICTLEPDGKLLVDKVLMKAEVLLSDSSEEEKHEIQLKLAKIKGLFEETTTYMIHCHSRIEWVWLHWNEYLRARDEFMLWVHNITLTLEPDMELQLGLKEKRWQYEQALVLMKDVLNKSQLVDRLLEEAASLYNRIGDPSVDESVQSAMMAEYLQIKKKAQERVERLEKILKEHEAYAEDVNGFKSWLNSVIEKLKCYVAEASNSTEKRLDLLQEISKDVENGNKQLEVLEVKSAQVIKNTSPLGAEKICRELEDLRKTLMELKQMNAEEEETLLKTHNSENAFLLLARQLEANINEFRKATHRLEESLESGERVKSEDDLIALWKTLNATKSALAAEEAKAERVKVQLRDLFKFSKDVQPLSDGVISAMRDYQRAKSKAFKLSTDTESELRQLFQNPLREFLYWKPIAESVLDATALPVNDGAMNLDALDNIEKLLKESCTIKDKLAALEKKKERILLVLGDSKSKALLQDITVAEKEREALHQDLLQRKTLLQGFVEQRKKFDSEYKNLHQKISAIRVKSMKENELQPDIIGKEAQIQRLQILLEELLSLSSLIQKLISMTTSHSSHTHRADQLHSDYLTLQRSLENKIHKGKENINNHRLFSHNLPDLQHWIMVTHQKLESYQNGGKNWEEKDIETLKAELSEKEIQRHLVEALGQKVVDTSSPEGAALIQSELKQLIDYWKSLQQLCEQMSRVVKQNKQHKSSPKSLRKPTDITKYQTPSLVSDIDTYDLLQRENTPTSNKISTSHNKEGQVLHVNSVIEVNTSDSPRNRGFQQTGDPTRTIHNVTTNSITDLPDGHSGYNGPLHKGNSHSIIDDDEEDRAPSIEIQGKNGLFSRISGSGDGNSSPGRSQKSKDRSAAVMRIDEASSIDRSSYEFRVINREGREGSQEDELSDRTGSSTHDTARMGAYGKGERDQSMGIQDKSSSVRISGSGDATSSPGRSPKSRDRSTAVRRIDETPRSSFDRNNYEFRVINQEGGSQEDEVSVRTRRTETDGHSVRSKGNIDINKKNISIGRGFRKIDKGKSNQEVNGFGNTGEGDDQSLEINSGSFSLGYKTSPHTPSKSNTSPAQGKGDLKSRTNLQQDAERNHLAGFQIVPGNLQITSGFIAEEKTNEKRKSQDNPGTTRRNRKFVSLAESVDLEDSSSSRTTGGNKVDVDHLKLLLEFEQWLQTENSKLNQICATPLTGSEGVKTRQSHLQNLKLRVPQGQKLFESLLQSRSSMTVTEDLKLEELRYQWMLYKSKLRDSGKHTNLKITEEPRGITKTSGGICSYLHRVCCAALPLQLLLLLLLLLAFLLPLLQETKNCALSNNFARSFNLMLKYNGPPPT
ncbi:nesprin-3 isoform X3 [Engystomops pustulosus]|uniref:nesprin-3 isoform X3 n=1 Tax=Engystomops pustulosus TaxID=76066 RepID=UPI003AFA0731